MNISPFHLAALAVAAVDGLQVAGTTTPFVTTDDYIYSGVVDVEGKRWIVKYPQTDQAGGLLEAEGTVSIALLDELRRGNLTFDLVRPSGWALFQGRRAMVYPEPLGKPCSFDSLGSAQARELGRVLASIHSLAPDTVTSVGMPSYSAHGVQERLATQLDTACQRAKIPAVLRRRWLNVLTNDALWDFLPTPIHGDIAHENVLWSDGSIRTVTGWGQASVGDPAADIAALTASLEADMYEEFLSAYRHSAAFPADPHLEERATFMSEFALLQWLMHGVLTHDDAIINEAQHMLVELSDAIEADPLTAPGPEWHVESPLPPPSENAEETAYFPDPPSDSTALTADYALTADFALTADYALTSDEASKD